MKDQVISSITDIIFDIENADYSKQEKIDAINDALALLNDFKRQTEYSRG